MTFYEGAPAKVPNDQTECRYTRWGLAGRAVRDALRLSMSGFPAGFVMAASLAVVTSVFIVARSAEGWVAQLVNVLLAVTVGTATGVALIALWVALPPARRYHWRPKYGRFTEEAAVDGSHTGLWIESRHWHTVRNLRCTVTDPKGDRWTAWWRSHRGPTVILAPGHDAGGFEYPKDFNAPWPIPGTYKVKWEMEAQGRTRPIIIYRGRWRVTRDQVE